ncbi:16S rRNA (guanine(966)-N(2))-methyltransferase RsmD [Alteromonas facilis]|uniref:16S rRNA (guanine(966)-N(2))-methyltransferase RsmD n=1 Tax=Alteromonas facilis TaxID=2048004 RepID=UPI000C28E3F5|nr:16S rRNA (guanine(966)-N(2))-methyltransferase RsmD [Alteromonas facilis]
MTRRPKRDTKPGKTKSSSANGNIRIIAGQWRGRKLPVLDAQGLRPTTDRAKETLFNWLMHDVRDAHCLDLFAGSGGLGFEALSRYAQHVTFVERDTQAVEQLKKNAATLKTSTEQLTILHTDALSYLKTCDTPFDIIFVDPPFNQGLLEPVLNTLIQRQLINSDTCLYIESEKTLDTLPSSLGFTLDKQKTTDQVAFGLWHR